MAEETPAKKQNAVDQVIISINQLTLEPDSKVQLNDDISKLFVEYRILGVPLEETECPFSLPKPPPGKEISFNFTKIFHVDFDNNYERRQHLASMLLPDDPDKGRIKFRVVSDPDDEDDASDCEDVGIAYASVQDIMDNDSDLEEVNLDIVNANDEVTVIGKLNVTIKCLDALKAVKIELD